MASEAGHGQKEEEIPTTIKVATAAKAPASVHEDLLLKRI